MAESKFTIKPVMNVDDVLRSANNVRKTFEDLMKSIDGKPLSKELSSVRDSMEETVKYMDSYEKFMKSFQKSREEAAQQGIAAEKELEALEQRRLELQTKKAGLFNEIDKAEEAGDTEALKALNSQLADVNIETQHVRESFEEVRGTLSYLQDADNILSVPYLTEGVENYRDNLKEATQYLSDNIAYWNAIAASEQKAAEEQASHQQEQEGAQAQATQQEAQTAPVATEHISEWKQLQQQIDSNTQTIIGYETAVEALKGAGLDTSEIQAQIDGLRQVNDILVEMQEDIGNISLSTIFDRGDIEGTAQRLRDHIQNITDSVEGTDLPSRLQSIADRLENLSNQSAKVNEEMQVLESKGMGDSLEYQNLAEKAVNLNNQMRIYVEKWNEAVAKMREAGQIPTPVPGGQGGGDGNPVEDAVLLREEYTAANRALMSLTTSTRSLGLLIPGINTRAIRGVTMLTRATLRLSSMTRGQLTTAIQGVGKAISTILKSLMAHPIVLAIAAVIAALMALKKLVDKTKEEVEAMGKAFVQGLSKTGKALKDITVAMGKGFFGLGTGVMKGVLNGITAVINKIKSLKSVITENIKLMAKWRGGNNALNQSMSNLTSSLAYLKAAFSSAFVPVITVIEPALTRLMNKLAEVMTMIGMFIAKISGASTFQKAIRVQKDYAKALNGTGSAAKKTLASFDELNILNGDKGGEAVNWEEVEMAKVEIPDLISKMRELGNEVGTKIRDILNGIPWDSVKNGADYATEAIAAFVNALADVTGLGKAIGNALAELGNTFVLFVNGLLTKIDFGRIGEQLGQGFQKFLDTFEFDKLGQVFSNSLNALSTLLFNFFSNFNGADLGKGLTEWFQNAFGRIDWTTIRGTIAAGMKDVTGFLNEVLTPENFSTLATSISEAFNSIFFGVKQFVDGAEWEKWGQSLATGINDLFKSFNPRQAGKAISDLAHGLLDMILTAIKGIHWDEVSTAIVDFISSIDWKGLGAKAKEISTQLMDALKQIWAALEESDAFDDIIELIVDFLKEKKNWEKAFKKIRNEVIRDVIVEKIKNALQGLWDSILDSIAPDDASEQMGTKTADIGKNIVEGILQGFTMASPAGFAPLFDWIWNGICQIFGIHSPATTMEPVGENIVNGVLEGFSLVDVGAALSEWWDKNIAPWFTLEKWKSIGETVRVALTTKMDEIKTNLTTKWENLTASLTEKLEILKEIFSLKFDAIKTKVIDAFTAIKDGIKTPINGIISFVESMVNFIINGINGLVDKINSLSFDVTNPITGTNYTFDVNVPKLSTVSIPRLAQGAVLPPNAPFLAMLGDQRNGKNIEAPLDTIKQALAETLQGLQLSGGGSQPINIYLGTDLIYSEIRKLEKRNSIIGG